MNEPADANGASAVREIALLELIASFRDDVCSLLGNSSENAAWISYLLEKRRNHRDADFG